MTPLRALLAITALALLAWGVQLVSCSGASETSPATTKVGDHPPSKETDPRVSSRDSGSARPATRTLMELAHSAYSAWVYPSERETLVVTPTAIYREDGHGKLEQRAADLGYVSCLHEDSIVFHRAGALRSISVSGGQERVILPLPDAPQYLMSAGPRLAWLTRRGPDDFAILTHAAGEVVTAYESTRELTSPVFHDGSVFFLERSGQDWKLGRTSVDGGGVAFGEAHQGRVPPMLARGPEGIYFYDGLQGGIRRVDFDLAHEEQIIEDVICSPLAVTTRILCAQVGSVVSLPLGSERLLPLADERQGPIAAISATDSSATWIVDLGRDRLAVRRASW